jgi:hypothetical protein
VLELVAHLHAEGEQGADRGLGCGGAEVAHGRSWLGVRARLR